MYAYGVCRDGMPLTDLESYEEIITILCAVCDIVARWCWRWSWDWIVIPCGDSFAVRLWMNGCFVFSGSACF